LDELEDTARGGDLLLVTWADTTLPRVVVVLAGGALDLAPERLDEWDMVRPTLGCDKDIEHKRCERGGRMNATDTLFQAHA